MSKQTIAPKKGVTPEWSIRDLIGVNLAESQEGIMGTLESEYDLDSRQLHRVDTFLDQAFKQAADVLAESITAAAFATEMEERPWA
ncbi:hypothetical protein CKALI_11430 [Corynebacterium kalinowskii]|uniref:Uncharacterized protein n=1 Tax=Corynebacterium kalinowskii TaxID=2675216 RepID=A0A6B8W0J8_9CORY|nr:hypothetical protein [Corynebacterium kalinowskii]QGU03130.1 hypothetical protein CKALI_11430 [Corynebacterium kalinowskii]